MAKKCLYSILVLCMVINYTHSFIPADIMNKVINKVDTVLSFDFGNVNPTLVHEEILRRGVIKSVAQYFYDKVNGSQLINLNKTDTEYLNINRIYIDYYGRGFCNLGVNRVIEDDLQPNVAIVDFSAKTKDLPYAHFDAEAFVESNQRVYNFTKNVYTALRIRDYTRARELSGQILHTIQDFYSHSNWVEIGNTAINKEIGESNFSSIPIIDKNESAACLNNCTITSLDCNFLVSILVKLIKALGITTPFECPLIYYKCQGNIVKLDKLVSGYYTGQKLEDETPVVKPDSISKCSHGGILDKSVIKPAEGISR